MIVVDTNVIAHLFLRGDFTREKKCSECSTLWEVLAEGCTLAYVTDFNSATAATIET
jgi:predicted nucleic acid-binding protein